MKHKINILFLLLKRILKLNFCLLQNKWEQTEHTELEESTIDRRIKKQQRNNEK